MPFLSPMRYLARVLAAVLGLWIAAHVIPGVHVFGNGALILAGLLLGLLNAFLRPVLVILTLPFTILTLGLFLFVVNGLVVMLVPLVLHNVRIPGLWEGILTALVISLVGWLGNALTAETTEGMY